jgi:hypothetical protein
VVGEGCPDHQVLGKPEDPKIAYFCIKTALFKDSYYWDTHKIPASKVADILGISVKTLKNREKSGFYPKPSRHPHSYYRFYSEEEVETLKKINQDNHDLIKNRKHLQSNPTHEQLSFIQNDCEVKKQSESEKS